MINLLLWIIAVILLILLSPIFYIFAFFNSSKNDWLKWKLELAIIIDIYGNVLGKYFWKAILIKKDGYKFGNPKETISSALGKNKLKGALTKSGKILCFILDTLDPNHCIKSIDYNV